MTAIESSTPTSRVLTLWSQVTGRPINTIAEHRLAKLDARMTLFDSDDDTLVEAAEQVFEFHGGYLAFADWADAIQNLKRTQHLQSGGSFADAPSLIGSVGERQRDHNQVTDFVGETVKAGWVAGIDQVTLREAMVRIDQRATMGHYILGSLVQRKTKWRKELADVGGTLPVIEADAAEALIVHLLALTHPDAQFSATPQSSDNRVFAGWKTNYHRDQEQRFYVTGLSDVVDSVSDIVQIHRSGDGGRFYVRDNAVECPDCHSVMAWVGSPRDQRQAPSAHLSRKERRV